VRREKVVGQYLPVGEGQKRERVAGEETELGAEAFELARPIGNDDVQPPVGAGGFSEGEGLGAAIELVPAQMPVGSIWKGRMEQGGHTALGAKARELT